MKANLGALGITIGLILVAASILAMGFMAGRGISELTVRVTKLEKQIPTVRAGVKRTAIVLEYAHTKAESKKRAVTLEDLKEGCALADKFMKE